MVLAAGAAAWLVLGRDPLGAVPSSLLGRWQPIAEGQPGIFLGIEGSALEWSAGPGTVERREIVGARLIERSEGGEIYALHFVEEDEVAVLRFELGHDGRAHVGGRRSVNWMRQVVP